MRRSVYALRPPDLEEGVHVADALREICERCHSPESACTFTLEGEPWQMNRESEMALYRIAQEALSNALRHAKADHIRMTLGKEGQQAQLTIKDDGGGFNLQQTARKQSDYRHFARNVCTVRELSAVCHSGCC